MVACSAPDSTSEMENADANKTLIRADFGTINGINEDECKKDMRVVSNASCTMNICSPSIAKLRGIEAGLMTIYDYSQNFFIFTKIDGITQIQF